MLKIAFVAIAALPLAACATTAETQASQLAYCQQMQRQMGTEQTHDHTEAKGMGSSAMNVSHERCRDLLSNS